MQLICENIGQIKNIARTILQCYPKNKKFLFFGDMGVGKTTLIKELSLQLGVLDNVSSPTYSIINEYSTKNKGKIYHFDFYRLKNEYEAFDLGCEEYFLSNAYCFIEWPERIPRLIDDNMIKIKMSIKLNNRIIDILI